MRCRSNAFTNRPALPSPISMNNGAPSRLWGTWWIREAAGGGCTADDGRRADFHFHRRRGRARVDGRGHEALAKRRLAVELLGRLRDHFAPQAMLHYGQGKWYPGEALPRWALSCYWRKDRVAIWENTRLIAEDNKEITATPAKMREVSLAKRWRAACYEVDATLAMPAYEDSFFIICGKERRLPVNVESARFKTRKPPWSEGMWPAFSNKGWGR